MRSTRAASSAPPILLLLVILAAFALRCYRLDFFSLRGDESFTVLFVQKPSAQMWSEILTVEPNPPLLYLLLKSWIVPAGDGEFATRFFSLWFGVLAVPLVYQLARRTLVPPNEPAARGAPLLAAFLIAINPYQIWHSQDVRNYTLWPALSLLALVLFWRWYAPNPGRVVADTPTFRSREHLMPLGGFILAELAALYTHYYEAFLLLALNLFVFLTTWRDRGKLMQWVGAQVVLALVYLPYPLLLSNRVAAYGEGSGRQGVALWDLARETFSAFTLGDTLDAAWRAWLWIPFALLALVGLIYLLTRARLRVLFFALYVGVPTLAVFALNLVRPLYLERYLNAVAPAYYILIAFGLTQMARALTPRRVQMDIRRVALVVGAAACAALAFFALSNYWTNPAFAKAPDWRGLTRIINANAARGDIIVQNFPETSLLYYDRSRLPLVVYPETYLPDAKTTRQLNAMNANYQRVWFIPSANDYWDPDGFVGTWLDHRTDLLRTWQAGEFDLRLYATPAQYLNTMDKQNIPYGAVINLLGYRTQKLAEGLRVVLYWRALQDPGRALEIRLSPKGLPGTVYPEAREMPVHGSYPTTQWRQNEIVVDQHDLPGAADASVVQLAVCVPNSSECLPIADPLALDNTRLNLKVSP